MTRVVPYVFSRMGAPVGAESAGGTSQMNPEIYKLATQLFCEAEWPAIQAALENCSELHTRSIMIDGELAAFVIVSTHDDHAFIDFCGVNPKHQGKGLGSKLLKETLSGIFQADLLACRLIVDDWNKDARRLYERLGFQQIGVVPQLNGLGYLMELRQFHPQGIAPTAISHLGLKSAETVSC